jgi:hypothetical protein
LTEKEQFEAAREIIRHEDGLINNRVTWLLVFQGFLFTAFVNGVGLFEKFRGRHIAITCITAGLVMICGLGAASNLTAYNVIQLAFDQQEQVKRWWEDTGLKGFPPLKGELGKGRFQWVFSTGRMPCILIVVWLALIIILLASMYAEQ